MTDGSTETPVVEATSRTTLPEPHALNDKLSIFDEGKPITVSCKCCEKIMGDSSAWIKAVPELSAVVFSSLVNIVIDENYQSVKPGPWDELSTYQEIRCQNCGTAIGKKYAATQSKLTDLQNHLVLDIEFLSLYCHGSSQPCIPSANSKEIINIFHPQPESVANQLVHLQYCCVILDEECMRIDTDVKDLKLMRDEHSFMMTKLRNLDALVHSVIETVNKIVVELQKTSGDRTLKIIPNGSLNHQIQTAKQLSSPAAHPPTKSHISSKAHSPPSNKGPHSPPGTAPQRIPLSSEFTFTSGNYYSVSDHTQSEKANTSSHAHSKTSRGISHSPTRNKVDTIPKTQSSKQSNSQTQTQPLSPSHASQPATTPTTQVKAARKPGRPKRKSAPENIENLNKKRSIIPPATSTNTSAVIVDSEDERGASPIILETALQKSIKGSDPVQHTKEHTKSTNNATEDDDEEDVVRRRARQPRLSRKIS